MKYQYVWFDLGGTLVQYDHSSKYAQVLEKFDIKAETASIRRAFYLADKTFMREYPHVLGTHPETYLPWYLGVLNYHLGVKVNLHTFHQQYIAEPVQPDQHWSVAPGAIALLEKLKRDGISTGLISNWDPSCRAVLRATGLLDLLDIVVVSSEVQMEKPDVQIFEHAISLTKAEPSKCLYVGDNYYDDVIGAQSASIDCLLLAPYGKLGMEEITYHNIANNLDEVSHVVE